MRFISPQPCPRARSLENMRLAFAAPVASAMARRNSSATASASNALPARRAVR